MITRHDLFVAAAIQGAMASGCTGDPASSVTIDAISIADDAERRLVERNVSSMREENPDI